jgi:AraC-like DNA-binding protein
VQVLKEKLRHVARAAERAEEGRKQQGRIYKSELKRAQDGERDKAAEIERLRWELDQLGEREASRSKVNLLQDEVRNFKTASQHKLQQMELQADLTYREQVAATQIHDPIEYGHHYLRDHFRSPLNLKEVAARCGVSREHFIRAFGKRYGETPGGLMRRLRLEHARRILGATQLPVQDVALASGFADANTFCRAYRNRYGATPGSLRPTLGTR